MKAPALIGLHLSRTDRHGVAEEPGLFVIGEGDRHRSGGSAVRPQDAARDRDAPVRDGLDWQGGAREFIAPRIGHGRHVQFPRGKGADPREEIHEGNASARLDAH